MPGAPVLSGGGLAGGLRELPPSEAKGRLFPAAGASSAPERRLFAPETRFRAPPLPLEGESSSTEQPGAGGREGGKKEGAEGQLAGANVQPLPPPPALNFPPADRGRPVCWSPQFPGAAGDRGAGRPSPLCLPFRTGAEGGRRRAGAPRLPAFAAELMPLPAAEANLPGPSYR